jgi:hypothetical protein
MTTTDAVDAPSNHDTSSASNNDANSGGHNKRAIPHDLPEEATTHNGTEEATTTNIPEEATTHNGTEEATTTNIPEEATNNNGTASTMPPLAGGNTSTIISLTTSQAVVFIAAGAIGAVAAMVCYTLSVAGHLDSVLAASTAGLGVAFLTSWWLLSRDKNDTYPQLSEHLKSLPSNPSAGKYYTSFLFSAHGLFAVLPKAHFSHLSLRVTEATPASFDRT